MTLFVVERSVAGIGIQALADAQAAAIVAARDSTAHGQSVTYLRSLLAPDDGRCFCMFEADRAEDVRQVNDQAGLRFERITTALLLDPPSKPRDPSA